MQRIFATGKFRIESHAEFQYGGDSAMALNRAFRGGERSGNHF